MFVARGVTVLQNMAMGSSSQNGVSIVRQINAVNTAEPNNLSLSRWPNDNVKSAIASGSERILLMPRLNKVAERERPGDLFRFQFNVPVGLADELRPAFNANTMRCVKRVPHWPCWLLQKRHMRLFGCSIGLASIAVDAGQNAIRPA